MTPLTTETDFAEIVRRYPLKVSAVLTQMHRESSIVAPVVRQLPWTHQFYALNVAAGDAP